MRKKLNRIAAAVFVAFALAISACGGDDDGGGTAATTTETGAAGAQGEKPGNGARAPRARTPEELEGCLEEGGYVATAIPAPPEGQPGSEFGSVGSVRLEVGASNAVVAIFFETAKDAKGLSDSALGAQGEPKVFGKVYLSAAKGRPKELGAFRSCLKG